MNFFEERQLFWRGVFLGGTKKGARGAEYVDRVKRGPVWFLSTFLDRPLRTILR